MPRHDGKRYKVDTTVPLPSPLTPIAVNSSARERSVSNRAQSVPIACEMVSAVIDVSVHVNVFIHVFHDDFLPRVIHIRSPIGDAIIIVSTVEWSVIRHIIRRTLADADIVGAPAKT